MGVQSNNGDENDSCCCCPCFSLSKGAATFVKYVFISLITWVICLLLLLPDLRAKAVANNTLCVKYLSQRTCRNFFGYNAVYRVYFSVVVFHFAMALCLIGASGMESDFRTRIHHGLWSIKCLALIGISAVMFFINSITPMFHILMYIGMACGLLFDLVVVLLLVDAVHHGQEAWGGATDDGSTKQPWNGISTFSSIVMYLVAAICIAILYLQFTGNTACSTNKYFIIFIICHCLVAFAVSMVPALKRLHHYTSSLQSALTILFTLLLTWSAVTHQPYNRCTKTIPTDLATGVSQQAVTSTAVVFIVLFYASIGSSQARLQQKIWPLADSPSYQDSDHYSLSFVHFLMFLGSFHIMMNLSNWSSPGDKVFIPTWFATWVKMGACCSCIWIYLWTLLSPMLKSEDTFPQEKRDIKKEFELAGENSKLNSSTRSRKVSESNLNSDLNSNSNSNLAPIGEVVSSSTSRPPSVFPRDNEKRSPFSASEMHGVRITHGSMSRKGSLREATPETGTQKEMIRLEGKVMKLQEKIAKLQTKVAHLQGLQM